MVAANGIEIARVTGSPLSYWLVTTVASLALGLATSLFFLLTMGQCRPVSYTHLTLPTTPYV